MPVDRCNCTACAGRWIPHLHWVPEKERAPNLGALAALPSCRLAAYALFLFAATFTFPTRFRAFFGCIEGWKRYSGSPIESFRCAGAGCL